MTDRATATPNRTYTVVHAHKLDHIEATYHTGVSGEQWTDLQIGTVSLAIYGDHSKTASLLMAAAAQCPDPPPVLETPDQVRERTLREDAVRGVGA